MCGMGSDKKWALLANHYDRSLMRNSAALYMGGLMTNLAFTPQSIPVDVYVNGVYQGAYTLVERVGVNENRVNIDKLEKNTGGVNDSAPLVTGGYLLEWDFREGGDHNVYVGQSTGWVAIKEPEDEDDGSGITQAQVNYIDGYLDEADDVLFSADFDDPVNGWQKYIDPASAVDFYIVQELTKNLDANMYTSVFMYKTRDTATQQGKLFMGPLWDFDTAMGDAEYPGGQGSPTGWYLRDPNSAIEAKQTDVSWFNRLNEDPAFVAMVEARWQQIYPQLQTTDAFIANQIPLITASANLNFQKWSVTERARGRAGHQGQLAERDRLPAPVAHRTPQLDERPARLTTASTPHDPTRGVRGSRARDSLAAWGTRTSRACSSWRRDPLRRDAARELDGALGRRHAHADRRRLPGRRGPGRARPRRDRRRAHDDPRHARPR